jgi:alkylated DNA repair protein alkB family protein 8
MRTSDLANLMIIHQVICTCTPLQVLIGPFIFRYAWSHGITPRKMDVVPTLSGDLTIQRRKERTSFTFRSIRKGECNCVYHDQCDSYKKKYRQSEGHIKDDTLAAKLESLHVHEV